MRVRVLGAAAGGGFPQWNCNCTNCSGLRHGTLPATARTQSSIAITSAADSWVLCNASPDIHRQIASTPALTPREGVRDSRIAAVMLVDGQIDHTSGLLLLREGNQPLEVWSTEAVRDDLTTDLPILSVLERYCGVRWRRIATDGAPFSVPALPGIMVRALPVSGKPGPYSRHRQRPRLGDNIGLVFRDERSGRQLLYAPGLAEVTAELEAILAECQCVLVDGTFWRDEELVSAGISHKRARDMGHLPQSGPGGMLEVLGRLGPRTRRVLIHINNTNPILNDRSDERAQLDARDIEVAFDGMEIAV
jgi:pyrroloquinoline quinone biosynthesis protein B